MAEEKFKNHINTLVSRGVTFPASQTGILESTKEFYHRLVVPGTGLQSVKPVLFFTKEELANATEVTNWFGNKMPSDSLVVIQRIQARFRFGFGLLGERLAFAGNINGLVAGASGTDGGFAALKNDIDAFHNDCTITLGTGSNGREFGRLRGLPSLPWTENMVQDGNSYVEGITATANGFRYSDARLFSGDTGIRPEQSIKPFGLKDGQSFAIGMQHDSLIAFTGLGAVANVGTLEFKLTCKVYTNN